MENKYYTPTIEEFYVGFECQTYYQTYDALFGLPDRYQWGNFRIRHAHQIQNIPSFIENKKCRVKYLDKDDVESLGFEKSLKNQWVGWDDFWLNHTEPGRDYYLYTTLHFPKAVKDLNRIEDNLFKIILHRHYKSDEDGTTNIEYQLEQKESQIVFEGSFKNKSELKKIMKQIGIL